MSSLATSSTAVAAPSRPSPPPPTRRVPRNRAVLGPLSARLQAVEDYLSDDVKKRATAARKGHRPRHLLHYPPDLITPERAAFKILVERMVKQSCVPIAELTLPRSKFPRPRGSWVAFAAAHRSSITSEAARKFAALRP